MEKHLHMVCLDVPYPMDNGGMFDLFCKIRALHDIGIKVHLHCFEYGRGEQSELNKYCEEVLYYKRTNGHKGFSVNIPYIVASRRCEKLLANLLKDEYPILLEGVHCTHHIFNNLMRDRKILLRLHNVESDYYYHLYKHERFLPRKLYYYLESKLLKSYEKKVAQQVPIIALALKDAAAYKENFHAKDINYVPPFIPFTDVKSEEGLGTFCLYHGNLSRAENDKAARWLIKNVFNKIEKPFIIAGKNPTARLRRLVQVNPHVHLVENPDEAEMQDLIAKAQINILPSFNGTGFELKLLNALFNGRHCVVNIPAVEDTGIEETCHIATDENSFRKIISQLYYKPFSDSEIQLRKKLLATFNNNKNAEALVRLIWLNA
ncbi:glycosyltransferase [Chitinophagaceae bacterium 26-R-25]|nr:glycosyltransferase [Chitinophagaceae bacterium 26-R-25]